MLADRSLTKALIAALFPSSLAVVKDNTEPASEGQSFRPTMGNIKALLDNKIQ